MTALIAEIGINPSQGDAGLRQLMHHIGTSALTASRTLAQATSGIKNQALRQAAANIRARMSDILAANARDLEAGGKRGLGAALLDRLSLTTDRVEAMADGLDRIAELPDPVGQVI